MLIFKNVYKFVCTTSKNLSDIAFELDCDMAFVFGQTQSVFQSAIAKIKSLSKSTEVIDKDSCMLEIVRCEKQLRKITL